MRKLIAAMIVVALSLTAQAFDTKLKPISQDGTRAICDLPIERHVQNIGGSDGAGLCVYTSVQLCADWHNASQLATFQKWASRRPGGSYPEKLDADITAFCASQSLPVPAYVQHQGGDESFLDLAMKTGRMVGVTYAGVDGFYRGPVAHMVNLCHLDADSACIVDNNRAGAYVWMSRKQFLARWRGLYDNGTMMTVREGNQTYRVGGGWAFVLLNAPPPPYPAKPASIEELPVNLPEVQNFGILLKPLQPEEKKAPQQTNFGLNLQKINVGRKYSLNGTEVSQAVAEAAVLADDSDRYSLTFVGMAVPTLPEAVRSKVHLQSYKPEEWEVKQFALKPGVTLRKPQSGRVGTEILQASTFDTNAVLAAISGQPVKPIDPPKVLTFTEQDLTSDAKAKLIGSGIGGFTLSVMPIQSTKAMPTKVESAPSPARKPVAVNAQGIPTEPAPPGKRWTKPGTLNDPGEWTLEDEPTARQLLPIFSNTIFRFNCVNGVCR
jgi:hypothetical protein